jgi:hypothetical protein
VVNTCRQLIDAESASSLLAVAVADQFDLIGYYDRTEGAVTQDRALVTGFLRSGSYFRDDEFFALYRRVGDFIADAALALSDAPSDASEEPATGATNGAAAGKPRSNRPRSGKPRAVQQ